ncbi:hypothetical protein B0H63DRAFT_401501 [Podospora didyma]|uniref:Fucose-specific lectin n=1 Tax=Podospora didyma TaxID=330526 RepID=A0AAE0K9T5_9PEZI|nr:hypothetical protein B0H63DRAFT_401501 [Podospora didyma]
MASSTWKSLIVLAGAISPAQGAITAWWNGIGGQIMLQNQTTGLIRYSSCNSVGTPAYSYNDSNAFSLGIRPMNGTPLAGAGYYNSGDKYTVASIWYMSERNEIANALYNCNMTTGMFTSVGNWVVSSPVPTISSTTGLSAILLGETGGYRVYYHDEDGAVNELAYSTATKWTWNGVISPVRQESRAIHSAFSGKVNISVVTPHDAESIQVTRYNSDTTWRITTLPKALEGNLTNNLSNTSSIVVNQTSPSNFTLAAWNGKPASLGISIDQYSTRFIYYIGNDSNLHTVYNKNWFWSQQLNLNETFFPPADSPNAELAIAADQKGMVRLYYFVKGQLAEVRSDNGTWKPWAYLQPMPKAIVTSPIPPAQNTSAPDAPPTPEPSAGLSAGAKAGIGAGVTLGVIAIGVLGAAVCLLRRKKDREATPGGASASDPNPSIPPYGSLASSPGSRPMSAAYDNYMWEKKNTHSPAPQYELNDQALYQLDSANHPMEIYTAAPRPMYELASESYSHELMADGHRQLQPQPQAPNSPEPQFPSPQTHISASKSPQLHFVTPQSPFQPPFPVPQSQFSTQPSFQAPHHAPNQAP